MKKLALILVLGLVASVATAQNSGNSSISQQPPASTMKFAIYATKAPGQSDSVTGKFRIATLDVGGYYNVWRDIFTVTCQTNLFHIGYDTNVIQYAGIPDIGRTNGQVFGWVVTARSNLLAGTVSAGVTGYTNSSAGNMQVSWSGQYTNVTLNRSPYLLCTNQAGSLILQPGEFINWTNETILNLAVKPF